MANLEPFTAVFEHTDDGWIFARCLEVPEAFTQGRDLEEARENLKEAIVLMLEERRERGERELEGKEGIRREQIAL